MEHRPAPSLIDGSSSMSIPRISLSLDNSNFSSTANVLSDLSEDKRKVLEHRLVNNPHAKNVETVVGFGENSRDKSFFPGAHINETSREKTYTPGAPVTNESSRDKAYIPGAPITPVKPCLSAAQAEAASRPQKDEIPGAAVVAKTCGESSNCPPGGEGCIRNECSKESMLLCTESFGSTSAQRPAPLLQSASIMESSHFSADELESSDDDSNGSASSHPGESSALPLGDHARAGDDDDGLQSAERKRKLFTGEDGGSGFIGGKDSGRTPPQSEKSSKKTAKNQIKRSKTSSDTVVEPRSSDRSPPKMPRTITQFFAPTGQSTTCSAAGDLAAHTPNGHSACNSSAAMPERDQELVRRVADLEAKERAVAEREKEIARREGLQAKFEEDALQRAMATAREDRMQAEALRRQHDQKVADVMKGLLMARAREERALVNARLAADTARVGRVSYVRNGMSVVEMWEDGSAWAELIRRGEELAAEKERLDKDKRAFGKRCKGGNGSATSATNGSSNGMQPPAVPSDEVAEQDEIFRLRLQKVKDKDKTLQEEKEKLEREKYSLIRELKRVQDQNRSKYNGFPLLNKRYLLLHLLGKGGFSEVYRAYDLVEMQEVACKIHELSSSWTEDKKSNYMKHATREYEIQKKLCHHRIVRLLDVFEISSDGFCTVLEFCDGGDLEQVLKAQKTLPEREARSIIMQVFVGLRYLNEQKHRVIHYDLKPANIIFHNGEVKISDFGLSKIMDEPESGMMELTSQGAGTYWYLPPECFEEGQAPPKISSKVDVWSAGVIFFQMLYGVKPFGHGMSQDQILRDKTIIKSVSVAFPAGKDAPRVSDRAKDFIRRCLAYRQADRPDVIEAFQDPYFRHTGRQATGAA